MVRSKQRTKRRRFHGNRFANNTTQNVTENKVVTQQTVFFFLSGFSFTDTDDSQDSRGREGTFFYSSLPLPPAHEHSDIYLQLCM